MALAMRMPDTVVEKGVRVQVQEDRGLYDDTRGDASLTKPWARRSRRKPRKMTRRLVKWGFKEVWIEEYDYGDEKELQAVKIRHRSKRIDHGCKLEAIAELSSQGMNKIDGLLVNFLGLFEVQSLISVVMQHMMHGNLTAHLQKPLPEDEAKQIATQVTEGIASLHENDIVHPGLHSENILVISRDPTWWVKVGDFGFSKHTIHDDSLQSLVTAQNYFAPEILGLHSDDADSETEEIGHTCAADMWSLGVMIFYVLFHEYPFKSEIPQSNIQGPPRQSDSPASDVSLEARAFVEALLTVDPYTRPSAAAALTDPWFTGVKLPLEEPSEGPLEETQEEPDDVLTVGDVMGDCFAPSLARSDTSSLSNYTIRSEIPETTMEPTIETEDIFTVGDIMGDCFVPGPAHSYSSPRYSLRSELSEATMESTREIGTEDIFTVGDIMGDCFGPGPAQSDASSRYSLRSELSEATMEPTREIEAEGILMAGDLINDISVPGSARSDYTWRSHRSQPSQVSQTTADPTKETETEDELTVGDLTNDSVPSSARSDYSWRSHRTLQSQVSETTTLEPMKETESDTEGSDSDNGKADILGGAREAHNKGIKFMTEKKYSEAEFMLRQAVNARKATLGLNNIDTLASMQQLGIVYVTQGEHSEGQHVLRATAYAQKQLLGPTDRSTLCSDYWLSKSLFDEGNIQDALTILGETAETQKFVLGLRHSDTLQSFFLVGQAYLKLEDYGNAAAYFEQAVNAWKEIFGPTHCLTVEALQLLGCCMYKEQRYEEARAALQQVAEVSNSLQALALLHEIGKALYQGGKHDEAQDVLDRVYENRKRLLGPDDEETVDTLFWLCSSLCDQDQEGKVSEVRDLLQQLAKHSTSTANKQFAFDQMHKIGKTLWYRQDYLKARIMFEEALGGRTTLLGSRHQDSLASRYWIARTLFKLEKYEKAREILERMEVIQEALLGPDHLDTQYSRLTLIQIMIREGGLYAALAPLEQATTTFERALGPSHADALECKHDLAKLFMGLRKYKRANIVLQDTLSVTKLAFGPEHEETLRTHFALGVNFYEWAKYEDALAQFQQVAGGRIATLGKQDKKTLDILFWIGTVLYALKRYEASEGFWRQVVEARRELLGIEHPDTQKAIMWLAYSLEKQNLWRVALELHKQVLEVRQRTLGPSDETTVISSQDVKRCRDKSSSRWPWRAK
ncbi:hypothetical protein BDV06DRAFT_27866 [Aspergillus oleicola]